ncbi:PspC domain-containing protein [Bacteroides heparinolyticus]|nr:PspC domain-containing protein [Bacteroides heparinolyticus]
MKKFYKCKKDRKIDGVCAGIGIYFNIDPTIVRLATALLACIGGIGIVF